MADLFLSYKSDDRQRATVVAEGLIKEGFDVWWDPALAAGEDYQEVIDRSLREALVVIVLWSQTSVKSRWVRSEATVGDQYGALAPAKIAKCDLPTAFVLVQTADLSEWKGETSDPKWREFVNDVRAKRDRRRTVAATSAPTPPDANLIESIFWQSIVDSGEQADFDSYLARYPNGHFVDLATRRRDKLPGGAKPLGAPAPSRPTPEVVKLGESADDEARPTRGKMVVASIAALALIAICGGGWHFWSHRAGALTTAAKAEVSAPSTIVDRRRNPEILDERARALIYKARDDAKLAEQAAAKGEEAGRQGERAAVAAKAKSPGTISMTHDGMFDEGEGTVATGLQGYGVRSYTSVDKKSVRYAGMFEKGKPSGDIVHVHGDSKYAGQMVDDVYSGYGVYTWPGGISAGVFKGDQLASGVGTAPSGAVVEGGSETYLVKWRPSGYLDVVGKYLKGKGIGDEIQRAGYEDEMGDADFKLKANPNDSSALNSRCWERATANKELSLALADCNEALRIAPKTPAFMDSRAWVFYRQGRFDDALKDWTDAVALDQKTADYLYGRGLAKLRLGRETEGQRDLKGALAMNANAASNFEKFGIRP